nr:MGMT family protein [Streptomyces sp. CB01580]
MSQHRTGAEGTGTDETGAGRSRGEGPAAGGSRGEGPGGAATGDARAADGTPEHADRIPEYAERVLDVADLIPPGRVMTYGDIAEWLGDGGPRQVGRVMALYGGAVPWWRVVRADGALLPGHELRALDHYREEDTPLREAPRDAEGHLPRLDMKRARWDGVIGDADAGGEEDRGAHI